MGELKRNAVSEFKDKASFGKTESEAPDALAPGLLLNPVITFSLPGEDADIAPDGQELKSYVPEVLTCPLYLHQRPLICRRATSDKASRQQETRNQVFFFMDDSFPRKRMGL